MDTTFLDDLGADSLDVFQIIMGIEEEFDIEVPAEEAEKNYNGGRSSEYDQSCNQLRINYPSAYITSEKSPFRAFFRCCHAYGRISCYQMKILVV